MTTDQKNRMQDREPTLDAENMKEQNRKNKQKIIDAEDKTTVQDKVHSPEGSKMDGSLDKKDYPFDEAEDQFEKKEHKKASTPVIDE